MACTKHLLYFAYNIIAQCLDMVCKMHGYCAWHVNSVRQPTTLQAHDRTQEKGKNNQS